MQVLMPGCVFEHFVKIFFFFNEKKFLNLATEDNLAHVIDIGDKKLIFALGIKGNGRKGLFCFVFGDTFE
jgi:hypothetical protein